MPQEIWFLLHVGHEVTFFEYLSRVLVYLVAFGGIGLLVYWVGGVIDANQSPFVAAGDGDEAER